MNAISKSAESDLQEIHRGLHLAMQKLINDKDAGGAEVILRQLDVRLANFLNNAKVLG